MTDTFIYLCIVYHYKLAFYSHNDECKNPEFNIMPLIITLAVFFKHCRSRCSQQTVSAGRLLTSIFGDVGGLASIYGQKSDSVGLVSGAEEASASPAPPWQQDATCCITSRNTTWRSLACVVVLAV
ncbi:hypothetical protein NDU88_008244 [Pleurodeles waltl]|uniref:Uncharacterized protein n=1 Tax=Pleurodeles waltl TaxID=8319 RepID=A0AAV7QN27_PLEWA|nr:hypothetical protein NDU88_008244 [Pleurodeles waltl]